MPDDPPITRTQRALALLEHIADGGPPQTHGELMRDLGIPRSTLSDLLAELRDIGYLRVVDRRYAAGPRLISLIHRGLAQSGTIAAVQPVLERVAGATGETAVYAIRAADIVVAVAQAASANPIRYVATLWEPFGLDTASGMVFRAFAADRPADLQHVREQGYAVYAPDASRPAAIAAPVRDARGVAVGAVAVVAPTARFADPERTVWPALRAGAAMLEAQGTIS